MATKRVGTRADISKINFKRLPNHIGVKIFNYLPIENQVKIGRVSRRFKELSTMVISTMTKLDMTDNVFKNANLEKLIRLSAGSLKRMIVSEGYSFSYEMIADVSTLKERIALISQLRHPQLIELTLRNLHIEPEMMRQLLTNCPNVRHLICMGQLTSMDEIGEFPSNQDDNSPAIVCEKVESLSFFNPCSVELIETVADICPQVKTLEANLHLDADQINRIVLKFLGLKQLQLAFMERSIPVRIRNLDNLRRLSSLRSLCISQYSIVDEQGATMISQLGQLEELKINAYDVVNHGHDLITWQVIAPLSRLENLRQFKFCRLGFRASVSDPLWLDQGFCHLSGHQRLEHIDLNIDLSPATIIAFAHNCPQLKHLIISNVYGVDSNTKAKQLVKALRGFIQESVSFSFNRCNDKEIWQSSPVQSALSRVNAAAAGRSIIIKADYPRYDLEEIIFPIIL